MGAHDARLRRRSRAHHRQLTGGRSGWRLFARQRGGASMSWTLRGSYVETCSCELMCPCNVSFDHGATYDFCRVTLVFSIRDGVAEGTDISGCKVALIADTPKVMTQGNWRVGVFINDA